MADPKQIPEDKESDEEEKEDEETFLAKYKLSGELPKKIPYSHEIFKPAPPMKWEDLKSFKEKLDKQKENSS